jgi:ketosteroid isomerase-like protein
MDEIYAINRAKTALREAFNAGDLDSVMSLFSPDLTNWCDGIPGFYPPEGHPSLRLALEEFFRRYTVEMAPVVIDIQVRGDTAYDYGWHKIWIAPKAGGERKMIKERYFELWRKQPDGAWKIELLMTNQEVKPQMLPDAGQSESFLYAAGMSYEG